MSIFMQILSEAITEDKEKKDKEKEEKEKKDKKEEKDSKSEEDDGKKEGDDSDKEGDNEEGDEKKDGEGDSTETGDDEINLDGIEGDEISFGDESETDDKTPEDGSGSETEDDLVTNTRELINSVLDALEAEMVTSGETLGEDESIDIGLELISKFADQIPKEVLQQIHDAISTYYEMETDEGGDEASFFEKPADADTDKAAADNEVTFESILQRSLRG